MWARFRSLAQLTDEDTQIWRVLDMRRPPEALEDLAVGQHLASIAGEQREKVEFPSA